MRVGLIAAMACATACSLPDRVLVAPPPVEARDIVVRLVPDPEDPAAAALLGWAAVPGMAVTLHALEGEEPRTWSGVTDAQGRWAVADVPLGTYRVEGRRVFSADERSQLGTQSDAVGYVGGDFITVAAGADAPVYEARITAARRRGLMISENAFKRAPMPGLGTYYYGGYLELYNNGTETVHLDGMQVAYASSYGGAGPTYAVSCEEFENRHVSTAGTTTQYLAQFPGSGTQYPVPPGGTVIIAMDAVDHRGLFPEMLDLSTADFELPGGPDNPAVPDMIDRSVRVNPIHTHGPMFDSWATSNIVLMDAADVSTYERFTTFVLITFNYLRLPGAGIRDVFTSSLVRYRDAPQPGWAPCRRFVHPVFDRGYAWLHDETPLEFTVTESRKVLFVDDNGQPVLQHTRWSAQDFHRRDRTPRRIVP